MRRFLPLSAAVALVSCAHFPFVVPAGFQPAPRRIAVVSYETGLIGGGELGVPVPVQNVAMPYAALKQALYASRMFAVADDRAVGTNPVYLAQPVERYSGNLPPLIRPILVSPAAAPALAQALATDVLLVVHCFPQVVRDGGFGPFASAHVQVFTQLQAYAASGALIWRDRFYTGSPSLASMGGFRDPVQLQNVTATALASAGQNAVGRLTMALSGQ